MKEERPYNCHYCGKGFKLKGHMTEHLRTHTGEKPFSCHICDKSFNRGSTLRKHVLAKHKEQRPYRCDFCYELFTEKLLMKRHIRKVHSVKLSLNGASGTLWLVNKLPDAITSYLYCMLPGCLPAESQTFKNAAVGKLQAESECQV
uniref:C2H2-type domain-containing protein n=1 Tax=Xiphophorus couchianus TaxID=32473 RepID=A0A3B5LT38_9TELE